MSLYDAMGGSGQVLEETVLWTNSSPTSRYTSTSISTSDDISNYEYIGVTYRLSTSNSTSATVLMTVADFKKTLTTSNAPRLMIGGNATNNFVRAIRYSGVTTIIISGTASRVGYNDANDANIIPTKIIGLK